MFGKSRPLVKKPRIEPPVEDHLQIDSSESSECSDGEEYEVERILAEKTERGRKLYLLEWKGYPVEESTWEPKDNILDDGILETWKERKARELGGDDPSFDVAVFEKQQLEIYQREKAKKKQLGLPVSDSESDGNQADSDSEEEAMEVEATLQDTPEMRRKSTLSSTQQPNNPSTSDTPLSTLKRQISQAKTISSNSESEEPLANRRRNKSIPASQLPPFSKRVATSTNQPSVSALGSTTGSTSNRLRSGSGGVRGKGALRGGSSLGFKNIFAAGKSRKKKPTLLESSSDPTKAQKLYGNWRIRRLAELGGRSLADKAPDISALPGGLFDPSKPSSYQPLRPESFRKTSANATSTESQPSEKPKEPANETTTTEENSQHWEVSPGEGSWRPPRATCFFWHAKGECTRGDRCLYLHEYVDGIPILPNPFLNNALVRDNNEALSGHSSPLQEISVSDPPLSKKAPTTDISDSIANQAPTASARPMWQMTDDRDSTCYFWHTTGSCANKKCKFLHRYGPNIPLAPPPYQERGAEASDLYNATCFTWFTDGKCSKASCKFKHYSAHDLPLEPAPEGYQPPPAEDQGYPDYEPQDANAEVGRTTRQDTDPKSMICFFWNINGHCVKGSSCRYRHDNTPGFRVAPAPLSYRAAGADEPMQSPRPICKFWAKGYCYKGDKCHFLHGSPADAGSVSDHTTPRDYEHESVSAEENGEASMPPRRKTDEFVGDERMFVSEEPDPMSLNRERKPLMNNSWKHQRNNKICTYWSSGNCKFGNGCNNIHEGPQDYYINEDEDEPMSDVQNEHELWVRAESTHTNSHSPPHQTARTPHDSTKFSASSPQPRLESAPLSLLPPEAKETQANKFSDMEREKMKEVRIKKVSFASPDPETMATIPRGPEPEPKRPKTKITAEDYRRKQAVKAIGNRAKTFTFGTTTSHQLLLDTGDLNVPVEETWIQIFSGLSEVLFTQSCLAQDFQLQYDSLVTRILWQGNLTLAKIGDIEAQKLIDRIALELQLQSSGLMAIFDHFSILAYPYTEDWKFLQSSDHLQTKLRYIIFESNVNLDLSATALAKNTSSTIPSSYKRAIMNNTNGLDSKRIFSVFRKGRDSSLFLMFPPRASQTAEFILSWTRRSQPTCKIYTSQTEGAWEYFVHGNTAPAVVLLHESVIFDLLRLPLLSEMIGNTQNIFSFWCISDSSLPYRLFPSLELEEEDADTSLGQITATRIFPHGAAILLTPSFVVAEPEATLSLLHWFFGKDGTSGKYKQSTAGTWKLVWCAGFTNYVLDLANSKATERDLFYEINHAKPSKDADATVNGLGFESCNLRYRLHAFLTDLYTKNILTYPDNFEFDEYESPVVYANWIDSEDEKKMAEWFAGWAMNSLDQFRKFVVLGTGPSSVPKASRLKQVPKSTHQTQTQTSKLLELSMKATPQAGDNALARALAVAAKYPTQSVSAVSTRTLSASTLRTSVSQDIESAPEISPTKIANTAISMDLSTGTDDESVKAQIVQLTAESSEAKNPQQLPKLNTSHLAPDASPAAATGTTASTFSEGHAQWSPCYQAAGSPLKDRPYSSGNDSTKSSRSGIVNENGTRLVPQSTRPSSTVRNAIPVRPGYSPPEDKEVYQNRRIKDGIPQYDGEASDSSSRRGSIVESPMVFDAMDVGSLVSATDSSLEQSRTIEIQEEVVWKEVSFEPTTTWYDRLKEKEGPWAHVFVDSWQKGFEYLQIGGVKKK